RFDLYGKTRRVAKDAVPIWLSVDDCGVRARASGRAGPPAPGRSAYRRRWSYDVARAVCASRGGTTRRRHPTSRGSRRLYERRGDPPPGRTRARSWDATSGCDPGPPIHMSSVTLRHGLIESIPAIPGKVQLRLRTAPGITIVGCVTNGYRVRPLLSRFPCVQEQNHSLGQL